ncbi:MAG: hypothetical protein M1814_003710 [Vezdaea aestivalis]|nr:MAG: hypothetical protein M1814_003710 [Vezdaea aestivalis]
MSELSKIFDEDGEGKQQRIQDFTSSQQAEVGVSDLITEPDLIAPHSSPEDDDEDAERNRDDLFRQYAANVEKWNAEAAEKLRTYRETPIYYSPSQHITTPQMSISISGPQNISITIPYPLDLTLTHHNNPRSQPITIRETGTPLDLQTHAFRLYTDDDGSPGLPVSHAAQTPIAAAESPINGPRSRRLQVGESETRSIELRTDLWELIAGMKLWIRLPHGMITGWQYGTSAVCFLLIIFQL